MGIKRQKNGIFSGFREVKYTKYTVFEGRILYESA